MELEQKRSKMDSRAKEVGGPKESATSYFLLIPLKIAIQLGKGIGPFFNSFFAFVRRLMRSSVVMRLLPIVAIEVFLNATVFLYAMGPWPWPMSDPTGLYVFLALAHSALLIGYLSAAFGKSHGYYGGFTVKRLFLSSLALNLLLLIPTAISRTGGLPNIQAGILDPGAAYAQAGVLRQSQIPIVEYLRIVFSPLLTLLLPCTIHYWKRLGNVVRTLAIVSIVGFISIYIAIGTNKAIADFIILVPWMILTGYYSGNLRITKIFGGFVLVAGVISVAFFSYFFTAGQLTRPGSGASAHYLSQARIFANTDNFLVKYLPPGAQEGALSLSAYLTQGYYAVYLSLKEPFEPMFGVGNSMFLYRNLAKITGDDSILTMPYPVRIEKYGWDAYGYWSSIYPWIASDVSFPGTLLIVFLIGRFWAMSWLDALDGHNPFAVSIFAQFVIMLFYFSANNQILQSGESLVAFYSSLLLWALTREKLAFKNRTITDNNYQ